MPGYGPVSVIDIGSNSVRIVIYERLSRAPTMLFNEKILAGLGKGLAATGRMNTASVEQALAAIRRFKLLAEQSGSVETYIIATAASRDAENGPEFLKAVEEICGVKVNLLSGADEARLSALLRHPHRDAAAGRAVAQRVVQQVAQRFLQQYGLY